MNIVSFNNKSEQQECQWCVIDFEYLFSFELVLTYQLIFTNTNQEQGRK